ncbi:hypothetical protein KDN32_04460 [Nocardioides sp. J2M5]|nr:hypothetical protein [Nocardioides palaemonis]MBS2936995.1 hypothetical protein [Nocardioides palaemonis]
MLLNLEKGVWRDLTRRRGVSFVDPRLAQPARAALVLQAAHTLLPEAGVTALPSIARDELQEGLSGPLRTAIADSDPSSEGTVEGLRDQLVGTLVATPGRVGALMLADRVHLSRLVRDEIPPIIASACVCWYGAYRLPDDPYGHQITTLRGLYHSWLTVPTERPRIEKQMRGAAVQVVGGHPDSLIARRV